MGLLLTLMRATINVRSKNLRVRRAQFRSKVSTNDQSTSGATNSSTSVHGLGDDDSQPKNLDAHLSKLGGPMRKAKRVGRRPNPLQTSWGLATGSPDGKTCPINKAREILFEVDAEGKPVNTQLRDVRLRHLQEMICVANAYLAGRKIRKIKKEQVMKG